MDIQIKRIYEPAARTDGKRVLVDRLWPRGMSRERAHFDEWLKDIAPSPQLRAWFRHISSKFDEFSRKYRTELDTDPEKRAAVSHLLELIKAGKVTLLYGAKNTTANQALVLQTYLKEKGKKH